MRVAVAIGAVGVLIASLLWGFGVGLLAAIGAAVGLLFGALRGAD